MEFFNTMIFQSFVHAYYGLHTKRDLIKDSFISSMQGQWFSRISISLYMN